MVSDLIEVFLRENEGQATLGGFPHEAAQESPAIFDKASVLLARSELERILDLVKSNADDPERHRTFQVELAKALKVIEPVYHRTHDRQLAALLTDAEAKLA